MINKKIFLLFLVIGVISGCGFSVTQPDKFYLGKEPKIEEFMGSMTTDNAPTVLQEIFRDYGHRSDKLYIPSPVGQSLFMNGKCVYNKNYRKYGTVEEPREIISVDNTGIKARYRVLTYSEAGGLWKGFLRVTETKYEESIKFSDIKRIVMWKAKASGYTWIGFVKSEFKTPSEHDIQKMNSYYANHYNSSILNLFDQCDNFLVLETTWKYDWDFRTQMFFAIMIKSKHLDQALATITVLSSNLIK